MSGPQPQHLAHHLRIRYTKSGKIRFVSHRDVARLFERACRKVQLPVAYSQGFSPRPKLSFGLALSVAHESDAEFLDVELTEKVNTDDLVVELTSALPDGLTVEALRWTRVGEESLQEAISSCRWRIEVIGTTHEAVVDAVSRAISAAELPLDRIRKGKTRTDDVRPMIIDLTVEGQTETGTQLVAELATRPSALRPAELVDVLGLEGLLEGRVRRTNQWTFVDGERREPVAPVSSTERTLECVS